jgi:transposase
MNQVTLSEQNNTNQPILYMAFELSLKNWKIGFGDGMKKRIVTVPSQNMEQLHEEIEKAKEKFNMAGGVRIVSCYEAGREGFWLHRYLEKIGIENIVVDSSSIEVNRRARRAKSDKIDVVKILQMLVRYHGGEEKAWSVLNIPTPAEEDDRRLHRELERLKKERTGHGNRIKALLFAHGCTLKITADIGEKLETLRLWDGSLFPKDLKHEIQRECERLVLVKSQIKSLEKKQVERLEQADTERLQKISKLNHLRGIGITSAWIFGMEFFGWRKFKNRREVGCAAGLVPTPYDSGNSRREQGISKAGNKRIRGLAVEIAWCWLRYQPDSKISLWFKERFAGGGKRMRRIGIVAVARRLLVELWRYLESGILPEGAVLKPV